jgi:ATP-dependent helicase/nuclease subunit A
MSDHLPPDQAERERALDININALAIAPAGSGKTSLLVARALKCLAVSREPEEVVAITFTNKAAAEIRARLVQALQLATEPLAADAAAHTRLLHTLARRVLEHAQSRGWQLLENPNRLRALTIDALNAELAARLPLLSGLGGPSAMTEDSRGLFAEAIQSLFAELEDPNLPMEDREALALVLRGEDNRLDRLLEPLTGMLDKREQWLGEILSQSEPAQDARLLGALVQSRLRALDQLLDMSSRHSLITLLQAGSAQSDLLAWAAQLKEWPQAEAANLGHWRQLAACLVTGQGTLRKRITRNEGFLPKQSYTEDMKTLLRNLEADPRKEAIEAACMVVINCPDADYPEHLRRQRDALARVLLRLSAHLRVIFSQRGEADFTEVAMAALKAVSGEGGYSEALDRADTRVRHLLVDEMQDTSESQVELLRQLTSGWTPSDGHSLFMVGDPQQSIYAFRKAEVRLFLQLWNTQKLGDVELERIQLSTNFRSQPPLIDWFNHSFGAIFPPVSDVYAGAVAYNPCAAPQAVTEKTGIVPVSIHACANDDGEDEATAVADHAARLLQQAPGTIAILARSRAQLRQTLAELRRRNLSYSCQDIDLLQDVPAVRDYLYLLRALWHAEDRLAWAVVLRSPLVGMSYPDLLLLSQGAPRLSWPEKIQRAQASDPGLSAEGRQRLQRFSSALAAAEQDPLLYGDLPARSEGLWHALGGPACVTRQELTDVQRAMQHARSAAASGEIESLASLERSLTQLYAAPSDGLIQVMTAHKSKGLEFDHVLLVGCGSSTRREDQPALHYHRTPEGVLLVPQPPASLHEDDPARRLYAFVQGLHRQAANNELLRLLYVCCTRARRTLGLFMQLDLKDEESQPRAGSFARLLWPVIKAECGVPGAATAAAEKPQLLQAPLSPRLPLDYRFLADDPAFRPRERRSLRPSEAALEAQETKPQEGDLYAQLVGVMYHEAMRRMARDGLEVWRDGGRSRSTAMASGFRHLGLPEPQVAAAVAHVLRLLDSTLASAHVDWMLAPRDWARTEYVLAGYREGQWISAIIDRCFEDDGAVWVIDYKTSTETAEVARRQHGEQLRLYAELLAELRGGPVHAALFMAASGELVRLS